MLLRHFDKNGFDRTLLPIFRGLRTREDLATMLLAFHHWRREMGKTIRDGLEGEKDDKIYTFQVQEELNLTVYHTHNHKTRGFFIDLLNEVCKEAGKKCTTVHDTFDKCHDVSIGENPDAAGVGLLARHFDGCPMAVSSGITQAVAFTDLWLDFRGPARFFVPVGNPDNFDPNDITGKRIGLVRGWDSNILCLKRNNIKGVQSYLPNKWFIIDVPSETSDRLKNEEIDAAFLLLWSEYGVDDDQAGVIGGTPAGLEPIGDVLYCLDGLGVGARKDSPIIEWFNAALSKLKKNGKFAELCRNAKLKYGAWGRTDCIF
ncbi:lysine/arginine/ornithine-binding periplasmic protein-like isoform X2 [Ptychodera flava]